MQCWAWQEVFRSLWEDTLQSLPGSNSFPSFLIGSQQLFFTISLCLCYGLFPCNRLFGSVVNGLEILKASLKQASYLFIYFYSGLPYALLYSWGIANNPGNFGYRIFEYQDSSKLGKVQEVGSSIEFQLHYKQFPWLKCLPLLYQQLSVYYLLENSNIHSLSTKFIWNVLWKEPLFQVFVLSIDLKHI